MVIITNYKNYLHRGASTMREDDSKESLDQSKNHFLGHPYSKLLNCKTSQMLEGFGFVFSSRFEETIEDIT